MLKMRLQRVGRKHSPSYRVLIVDSRQGPKSGKYVDQVGSYDPRNDHIALDGEKAKQWIAKGVQTSGTVHNLLINQGVIEGKKINVLPRKSPIKTEGAEAAAPVAQASVPESAPEEAPEASPEEVPALEPAFESPAEALAKEAAPVSEES